MSEAENLPLAGIKVLDFGHMVLGPTAELLLADLGADVIKIEPPEGDPTRRLPGFATGFFGAFNRNKRSIALGLKTPEGKAVLLRLAADADVVSENFGAGAMDRLGLGWDVLRAANPRLIYLSLKGYLAGPYENRGALDEVIQMQTGIAYMTGPPGQPLRAGASIVDILGAVFGVVAVQAALRERDRTGLGQRVGSSLFETGAFLVSTHIAGNAATGTVCRRCRRAPGPLASMTPSVRGMASASLSPSPATGSGRTSCRPWPLARSPKTPAVPPMPAGPRRGNG
jgi:crotonobetainyl-CoA:carnitine CoA-transferase CaiB-like acyl-CoA transferase